MMYYLACPFTHPEPKVQEERFRIANQVTAELLRKGLVVFSPITHSVPLADYGLPTTWTFWEQVDKQYLERCDELLVLTIPGWKESVGVQAEIRIATELGIPISYLDPPATTNTAGACGGDAVSDSSSSAEA